MKPQHIVKSLYVSPKFEHICFVIDHNSVVESFFHCLESQRMGAVNYRHSDSCEQVEL